MSGEATPAPLRAVGIKLSEDSLVPVVILKAAGEQAAHVIAQAGKDDVPIVQAPALSSRLYRIPVEQAVTPDLFPIMAALLAHVIQVDKSRKNEVGAA